MERLKIINILMEFSMHPYPPPPPPSVEKEKKYFSYIFFQKSSRPCRVGYLRGTWEPGSHKILELVPNHPNCVAFIGRYTAILAEMSKNVSGFPQSKHYIPPCVHLIHNILKSC